MVYWWIYHSLTMANICQLKQSAYLSGHFFVMFITSYPKIKLIIICRVISQFFVVYVYSFWCINKVYRPFLKCDNLQMMHTRPGKRQREGKIQFYGVYSGYQKCQLFFSVNAGQEQHSSLFVEKIRPMKRVCPFKEQMVIYSVINWQAILVKTA